ncbi:TPA: hypothetical protein PXM11_001643 [Yersinia enterocolitica]|uniref:hypothetical protein n=1 Tax=Yersinia enterocolitica TaxID=630 RepID=UPI0005E5A923|nr:hypothetical protein [Yersinia enterocolitica]CNF78772.1 Uncharacterised protein [Yersinia enterocolitica]HDL6966378.1 hypothetical protein [Yersinia enterocolitica]HDL6970825.1 hypothetical protein [Yersinia enterocolitica]HDL6974586.1 hypothetical protein [Yersinia enterocolitica]HDL6987058.1 hypothetical protein [Yersinia enterocolitica]
MIKRIIMVFAFVSVLISFETIAVSYEIPDHVIKKETKAGYLRCKLVSEELKQQWLYYDNFKINQIAFSTGGGLGPNKIDINHYECTISAESSGGNVRRVRVNIDQRSDSNRVRWAIRDDYPISECTELYLGDCPQFKKK